MGAPFLSELLGRRNDRAANPNICDKDSEQSVSISGFILDDLGLPAPDFQLSSSPGTKLEHAVRDHLERELNALDPRSTWDVRCKQNPIESFSQYAHLADLRAAIEEDDSATLQVVVGGDYLVKPDVTVGRGENIPALHASVSCKWTLRSDRAQNARTEARGLLQHRKGRAPHIVVVTAEPLPSRLASLAFGTGDIDAMYHICFPSLITGVEAVGNDAEKQNLEVMVGGNRLLDYAQLPEVLAFS